MNNFQERALAWAETNENIYVCYGETRGYDAIVLRYNDMPSVYSVNGRPLTEVIEEWEQSQTSSLTQSEIEQAYQRGREDALKELETHPKFPREMRVWHLNSPRCKHRKTIIGITRHNTAIDDYGDEWIHYEELPAEQPKKMRPMTHAEVFKAIRDGAVLRMNSDNHIGVAFNGWGCDMTIGMYEICYNYTGGDADVWQKMEVEDED